MDPRTITQFLTEHIPDVIALSQFGSQVRGASRLTSDIDLAVLARRPIPAQRLYGLPQDPATRLYCDVDLVDLRSTSTVMRIQVISTGQRLEIRDDQAAAEFEMYAYADYARLNEERKGLPADIKRRGLVYG